MRFGWLVLTYVSLAIPGTTWALQGAPSPPLRTSSENSISAEDLINRQRAFLEALERGDAEYVKNILADDFVVIDTNGDTAGKLELLRSLNPEAHSQAKPILYQFRVVALDPTCVVVTYNAVFHGAPLERYQHLSDTWVQQGGEWKLKFQQSTLNLWSAHDLD
ncbi:MAG: nuclear transport factor 2 family protein [Acidobacteria bacterium]|nr:nuclear transport factor 2 family protein [Acidobacteriota bacterium]